MSNLNLNIPTMHYEGDDSDKENLVCVWMDGRDELFRCPYKDVKTFSRLLNCHFKVRHQILEWAERMVSPD